MKKHFAVIRAALALVVLCNLTGGCRAFRISVKDKDPDTVPALTAKYDQSDLRSWGTLVSDAIISHPFPVAGEDNPIVVVMGIQNRTRTHMDMKALSDTISTKLMEPGRISFVNVSRRDDLMREQGYQLANCTEATKVAIGKQLGAAYMLTGSLVEIGHESGREARLSRKEDVYYQLTVEITDLQTGLIALRKQKDRLRRVSKPLIGW